MVKQPSLRDLIYVFRFRFPFPGTTLPLVPGYIQSPLRGYVRWIQGCAFFGPW